MTGGNPPGHPLKSSPMADLVGKVYFFYSCSVFKDTRYWLKLLANTQLLMIWYFFYLIVAWRRGHYTFCYHCHKINLYNCEYWYLLFCFINSQRQRRNVAFRVVSEIFFHILTAQIIWRKSWLQFAVDFSFPKHKFCTPKKCIGMKSLYTCSQALSLMI